MRGCSQSELRSLPQLQAAPTGAAATESKSPGVALGGRRGSMLACLEARASAPDMSGESLAHK